jgi:hypothetical protein
MALDITAVGTTGTHTLTKTNLNLEDDYLYINKTSSEATPTGFVDGAPFIYRTQAGSVGGLTSGNLVYIKTSDTTKIQFSSTLGGSALDLTSYTAGTYTFNYPNVYSNKFNTATTFSNQQAVKYYTGGTPLTGLSSGSTYYVKSTSSPFSAASTLYSFSTLTFGTGGATGRTGPTLAALTSAYSASAWTANTAYFNQGTYQGYQDWTVPATGTYEFTVSGAPGRAGTSAAGGGGAVVKGQVSLTVGEIITIVCGQKGSTAPESGTGGNANWPGASGATFVVRKSGNIPLFVAGGGGSATYNQQGFDAVIENAGMNGTGSTARGTSGNGATGTQTGGAGGGFLSAGSGAQYGGNGGGFNNGLVGGTGTTGGDGGGHGGFGGGGGGDGSSVGGPGGSGGYSGGSSGSGGNTRGGAGGSYIIPSATNVATSTGQYNSATTFNSIQITNLASFNVGSSEGSVVATLVGSTSLSLTIHPDGAAAAAGTGAISIAPAGSAYHAFVPITLDLENDTINTPAVHGLSDGDAVVFSTTGTAPTPINTSTTYYVNKIDNYTYKLSTTPQTAGYTNVNFTIPATQNATSFFGKVVANISTDTITIPSHGFLANQPVKYQTNSPGSKAISTATRSGTTVTMTTATHGASVGQTVTVAGTSEASLNGAYTITGILNTTQFTYTTPTSGTVSSTSGGTATIASLAIAPLQDGATYYVKTVVDANNIKLSQSLGGNVIDLTSAGTGTAHSFIYVVVNLTEESLYIPGHDLVTGSKIIYSAGAGTPIGGLTSGATYFAYKVDANIIRLSTTKDGASIINLTSLGTGNHTLTTNSVDIATETISIPSHGFSQGELVQYDSVGQTVITGLSSGNPYYIILVDGDNIKLATTLENANAGTAVNLTGLGVGRHRILSLSKSPDGTYTIATTPTTTTFTVSAGGYVPLIVKEFTPRQELDLQANSLRILDHGFITGTKVTYNNNSGTSIGGLTNATDYYVIGINKDYIRLATTAENASSGVPVVFTTFGAGIDHRLTASQINGVKTGTGTVSTTSGSTLVSGVNTQFSKILKVGDRFRLFPPDTVLTGTFAFNAITVNTANTITLTSHSFNTGDCVKYNNGGGGTPTGLTNNQMYFVRRVDSNTVKLFNLSSDATANTNPVVITTQGSGAAHTIKKTTAVQPIVRRISAIGSDTQITVDRPYSSTFNGVYYSYQTFIYVRPQGYSLHRPFDGGVEMSTGSGTSWSQIIRQTRKYFRYQSGKGLQTSFGINFKPTIDIETLFRVSSTTFQGTTRRPHGLINGLYIKISQATTSTGATSTVYNGTFQVTVIDSLNFTCIATTTVPSGTEAKAYGFPQFNVTSWNNGAIRAGMFDFQNGMFFEFDGQKIYAVRRSSTQQISGTISALQGSEFVFGTGTTFTTQLAVNDFIVLRGQSYKVSSVISNTRITIKPEYKGASGTDKEFVPGNGSTGVVRTADGSFVIQNHGFVHDLPVVYNSIDGTVIGGLINGRTYYINLIDNNNFKLKASPDAATNVTLSDAGTGSPHSFTPAKSGIIGTKTVDTRTPQENWSIDPCDGTGPTGYNLDLDKIQMGYMDYSWYGAGKIRYGFKGTEGEVVYVHEYIHNNYQLESYFRSGNLPTRYEVVTYDNPTYIPFLFHWGTSVIMDGKFDDDKAYLFTQNSQTLTVTGTTPKSFGSTAVNIANNQINIPTHGFATGNSITFIGLTSGGIAGSNTQNPTITAQASLYNFTNIQNNSTLFIRRVDADNVTLHPTQSDAVAGTAVIDFTSQGNAQYTYYLYPVGSYNNTSGPNYQPLLSIRLSPSVSSGLTGKLGDRDVINRMQLRMQEIAVQTTQLVDVKVLINPRLNNLNFAGVASPSLTQIIQHTSNDTVSGGTQIYNFRAAGQNGVEASTTVDVSELFELSNSILGGDSVFPDGPDILTIAVSRLTGSTTLTSAKLTWTEAQA